MTTFFLAVAFTAAVASTTGMAITAAVRNVITAFRMASPLVLSEGERLGVDEAGGNVGTADVPLEELGHRRRPADVDLALGDVGNELTQMTRRQQPPTLARRVIAHHEQERDAALVREALELFTEDEIGFADDAVDDDHVAGHVFHQGADRRDPDPAGDQNDLLASPRGLGEDAERPFRDDSGPGTDLADAARKVAERLDGDPERPSVRRLGQRERMRRPPRAPA